MDTKTLQHRVAVEAMPVGSGGSLSGADDSALAMGCTQQKVSYSSLPQKCQLFILLSARFTEPLIASSIQSYIFFQLRHFNPSASAAEISAQAGLIVSCKTAAHVCTGLVWGRLADSHRIGRKTVLIVGLVTSSLATIGYGFSTSFLAALTWQILDGALNSTIAMVRCMVAELNPEKRYRARALTLLPLFANAGSLLGPLIGGFLAAEKTSTALISRYPYAAPNILVGCIQAAVALGVAFGCHETLGYAAGSKQKASDEQDAGRQGDGMMARHDSVTISADETSALLPKVTRVGQDEPAPWPASLGFREMWTKNVVLTMLAQFIIAGHLGTFSSLWAIFLSTPIVRTQHHAVLHLAGGLGLNPRAVGIAMSFIGFLGIVIQVVLYPTLQDRFGTIRVWRMSLFLFPVVYLIAPLCAPIAGSPFIWPVLVLVVLLFVAGRTGVVPATSLLINDCTPHPSVRGTVHTTAIIVVNLSKAVFPTVALAIFGLGQQIRFVALGFWFVAALAVLSCVAGRWVKEGSNGQ